MGRLAPIPPARFASLRPQCGVVGLKPTYGRVSVRGVIPLSLFARPRWPNRAYGSDAAVILQAIAGYDTKDPHSADASVGDYLAVDSRRSGPLRIGVPRKFFFDDLDSEVSAAMEQALEVLSTFSGGLREIEVDIPADRTLQTAESYLYHAEFVARRPELYQPETLRRIRSGERISAAQLDERRSEQELIRREIHKVFRRRGRPRNSDYASSRACNSGTEAESRPAAAARTSAAEEHAASKCLGIAGDLSSLRIHRGGFTHRAADHRATMARGRRSPRGLCL